MNINSNFVIFGGGGIRGIAYCGALKALEENNIEIMGCAGSSVGAVFAGLYSLGYNYDEIFEMSSAFGIHLINDINIDIKKEIAVSRGNKFYDWIKDAIEKKFYANEYRRNKMPPVCFKDIDKKLVIYSVDLKTMSFFEFSKDKTPDAEIATAIRASVSLPGLFTPLEYEDRYLVDGDLLKALPLWRVMSSFDKLDCRLIEFRLEDNETIKDVNNSIEYLNRVYNAICGFATDYIIDLYKNKDKFNYIKINTPDVSVFNFMLPDQKKHELFKLGYEATNQYFKDFYPSKKEFLKNKYKTILTKLLTFQKEFSLNKYINSYVSLCEIFVLLCEEKQYIDTDIYNMIINLKEIYLSNYKTCNIFGFKKAIYKSKEKATKIVLDIVKCITLRVKNLSS